MVTHSSKDYLKNMSTGARKVVTYYKLRDMSEKNEYIRN